MSSRLSDLLVLDSTPLNAIIFSRGIAANVQCSEWFEQLLLANRTFCIAEIIDYEIRRSLTHALKNRNNIHRREASQAIARLDALKQALVYIPLTTEMMLLAAELWADARIHGHANAGEAALDGDVILAAQTRIYARDVGREAVVVTSNKKHLQHYTLARTWQEIMV